MASIFFTRGSFLVAASPITRPRGLVKNLPTRAFVDTIETLFFRPRHEPVALRAQKDEVTREEEMQIGRLSAGFSGLLAVAAFLAVEAPAPSPAPAAPTASADQIDQAVSFAQAQADAVAGKKSGTLR
jgi:hypothetical protein